MAQKKSRRANSYEKVRRYLEKCELCNKKGKIEYHGSLFCGDEHLKLYKKKWRSAQERMKRITKCSICGKPVGKNSRIMVDCRIKKNNDRFTPHRFCSQKCFESWEL